jgi:hypothetical protein
MQSETDRLDALEQRILALGPGAYSCTLEAEDLALFGIPTKHKRRRGVTWTLRKISAARIKIAERVASRLTGQTTSFSYTQEFR